MAPSIQVNCLLRSKMILHAPNIEQPVLLAWFATSTFQTSEGLHTGDCDTGGYINRVARLESIERWVSCEDE